MILGVMMERIGKAYSIPRCIIADDQDVLVHCSFPMAQQYPWPYAGKGQISQAEVVKVPYPVGAQHCFFWHVVQYVCTSVYMEGQTNCERMFSGVPNALPMKYCVLGVKQCDDN